MKTNQQISVGDRVRITDVKFREHAHHACMIGKTGIVKRIYKTKPFIEITLDDGGKPRECCPEYLERTEALP